MEAAWKRELTGRKYADSEKNKHKWIDLNYGDLHFNDRVEKWTWSLEWTNLHSAVALLRTVPLNQRGRQFSKELTMQEGPSVAANRALCHLTGAGTYTCSPPSLLPVCLIFLTPYLLSCFFFPFSFLPPAADTVEWKPAFDVWDPIMLSSRNPHACYL